MTRLSFRCTQQMVDAVDQTRGQVPRERWLRDLVANELGLPASLVDLPDESFLVRSSADVKAGVQPIPKPGAKK